MQADVLQVCLYLFNFQYIHYIREEILTDSTTFKTF